MSAPSSRAEVVAEIFGEEATSPTSDEIDEHEEGQGHISAFNEGSGGKVERKGTGDC